MRKVYKTTFKLRRGKAENWEKNNPILQEGEPGFALDTNILKIGDGKTRWLDLKAISSEDAISTPATAAVGQVIAVKAVDENGKPTEWEAVDMPEQANANWNQNDETALDYVKGRTHYSDVKMIPETREFTAPFINDLEFSQLLYEQRKDAIYIIDGVNYTYVGDDEALPGFAWLVVNENDILQHVTINSGQIVFTPNASISINKEVEEVHKLDEKYIPDSVAFVKNVPPASMLVTTTSVDAGSAFAPSATFAEMLEALEKGATVWVQISGYRCLVTTFSTTKIQCKGLGTKHYTMSSTDTYFR